MLFSSALFLIYFLPVFLVAYQLVPFKFKNPTAFLGSFIFYAWGAPIFCLVLLLSSTLDFVLAQKFDQGNRKSWLTSGLIINVATLFVFKYFNFFTENVRGVFEGLGLAFPSYMEIALPLGVSFFTFQKISYLVDVYRNETPRAKSLLDYLLFVFLFPQLIAGPIVRYKDISNQLIHRSCQDKWGFKLSGLQRFILGLTKKVLIADGLTPLVDAAFASDQLGAIGALLGLLAYTFQIYFDFSGYTDMAIGLGMLMGFKFPENFNWPYAAAGFQDFWRRWHMTLSSWMRDYLYFPLGGSRKGQWIVLRNLWIVFLLSGLWHGASWNFVIWGAWHGLFLTVDRFSIFFKRMNHFYSSLLTFVLVMLGWIWFRAETLGDALNYFGELLNFQNHTALEVTPRQWLMLCLATVFSFLPPMSHHLMKSFHGDNGRNMVLKSVISLVLFILCLGQIAISDGQSFIYFRF